MFGRSLLVARRLPLIIQKATFARKVITPRIVRVLDKDAQPYQVDSSAIPRPSMIDHQYDDSFMFGDHVNDASQQVMKITKVKSSEKARPEVPLYQKANDRKNEFKAMMTNLSLKKRRDSMNFIVLEGKRLINDAIEAGIKLKYIYFTLDNHLKDIHHLEEIMQENDTKLMKVLYKDMKIYSPMATAPGIMAIGEKPDYNKMPFDASNQMPLILICDNIRDPGNLGTILRSSAAAGVSKILLTMGCVDAWNEKVIKSGAGAHFRVPLHLNIAWSDLAFHLPDQFDLYVADSKLSDSPNLASEPTLKTSNYFDAQFFAASKLEKKVLIIANEAFGPSNESYQLAEEHSGCRVTIPLFSNVESLNSAVASSILLFEFRKQFESSQQLSLK